MQKMYDNRIMTSTLVSSSQAIDYPLENLKDTRLAKAYRTTGNSNEWVKVLNSVTASRCAIMGHNLTSAAVIRLQGNATDVWTSPAFNEIVSWKEGVIIHKFTETTYAYWRLLITDPARTYISLGGLFLGKFLQEPSIKPDAQVDDETDSESSLSAGGQLYGNEGFKARIFRINYNNISDATRAAMRVWWNECRNIKPFILELYANRQDIEPPMYCFVNQKAIQWKRTGSEKGPWIASIEYKECF